VANAAMGALLLAGAGSGFRYDYSWVGDGGDYYA